MRALNSITSFDQVTHIALWAGQISLLTAIAIFAFIAFLRVRLTFRQKLAADLINAWRPALAEIAFSKKDLHSAALPVVGKRDRTLFLRQWCTVQETLSGNASSRLNEMARALGLDIFARQMLGHRRLNMRLLATVVLGHMRNTEAWLPVWRELDSQNTLLSLISARALVQISPSRAIPELIARIPMRQDWPDGRVASILTAAGQENIEEPLRVALATAIPEHAISLLKFVPIIPVPSIDELVSTILGNATDPALIAACLKVLRIPSQLPLARKLATHEEWFVRVLAVKFLGQTGTAQDTDSIIRALTDTEWWVRYRAAQALCQCPWISLDDLRSIQRQQSDKFAHDILEQVISEASYS